MRKEQREGHNEVIGRVGLMDGKGLVVRWIVDEVNGNIRSVLDHAISTSGHQAIRSVLGHALQFAIILSFLVSTF